MNSPVTAQLEGIEHLSTEQVALFTSLNQKQQAAFLVAFPAPAVLSGPLYPVITYKGKKEVGIPTWKLAKSFIGAARLADIIDAGSAAIKAGTITTAEFVKDFGIVLVHSDDSELDATVGDVELDTAGARAIRDARDAAYRAANPRQGNGAAQIFTPVAQMP